MKDIFYVYLAGPILGSTYNGAIGWRDYVKTLFPEEIICLSPMRNKLYLQGDAVIDQTVNPDQLSSPKGINTRDRNDVMRCDVILVNFLDAHIISVGTCIELGWADMLRKPIVIAMKETDLHYHKMVCDIAGYTYPNIEEAAEMVKKILLP